MRIVSTNIAQPTTVTWKSKEVVTGIFKEPVDGELVLEKTDVKDDHVIDRRYHGGEDKACYMYSVDHYPFWKEEYPDLNWTYGMFGENLTVEGLDETQIHIGDTYKIGSAIAQVCQPRQPCFKLGIKFEDPRVLKNFIAKTYSGVYLRILKSGAVAVGASLELQNREGNGLSVAEVFSLLYNGTDDDELKNKVTHDQHLPKNLRDYIIDRF